MFSKRGGLKRGYWAGLVLLAQHVLNATFSYSVATLGSSSDGLRGSNRPSFSQILLISRVSRSTKELGLDPVRFSFVNLSVLPRTHIRTPLYFPTV